MADEAVTIELFGQPKGIPRRRTVGDNNAIEKGAVLQLIDPNTASGSIVEGGMCAGIAAEEKESGDGATTIGCYTQGVFDLVASGAITVGDAVAMSASINHVKAAPATVTSGAAILGYAEETAANGETIRVRLDL